MAGDRDLLDELIESGAVVFVMVGDEERCEVRPAVDLGEDFDEPGHDRV